MSKSPAAAHSRQNDATPCVPARFWWTKRLAVVAVVYVLAVVVGFCVWFSHADRAYHEAMAKLEAAGEPARLADVKVIAIPEEQDAGAILIQAAEVDVKNFKEVGEIAGRLFEANNWPAPIDETRPVLRDCAPILAAVRKARGCAHAYWGLRPDAGGEHGPHSPWCVAHIRWILGLASLVHHADGDDDAAVESLRDLAATANHLREPPLTILYSLLATTFDAVLSDAAERILPDVRVTADGGDGAASRAQVAALITTLLDEARLREAAVQARVAERAFELDMIQQVTQVTDEPLIAVALGKAWTPDAAQGVRDPEGGFIRATNAAAIEMVLRTAWKLDGVEWIQQANRNIDAARAATYPEAVRRAGPSPNWSNEPGARLLAKLPSRLSGAMPQPSARSYAILARRRMTAVAFAVRLYETDHGRRPASLADLTPDYLSDVPLDPFREPPAPLKDVLGGDHPRLYSAGKDGVDNNGDDAGDDIVFRLDD